MPAEELYQARHTREIDRVVIEKFGIPGITLMRRAGEAAFRRIMSRHSRMAHPVVVCGAGNNGGDGYMVARCARRIGIAVRVLAAAEPKTADAAELLREYRDDGGVPSADPAILDSADLVVDALFGTGLDRAPQGAAAECIRRMNSAPCPVVSLDIPSGLHSDTGFAFEPCVRADATVTFIGRKLGLFTGRGREQAGEIMFEDLHIPAEARRAVQPAARIIPPPALPTLPRDAHKGDAGRILVVGGGTGMLGATLLAGEAALRCGGGLVTIAGAESHLDRPALARPELMSADALQVRADEPGCADAIILGPGLGQTDWSERVFERFADCAVPMVVDADGLTHLARAAAQSGLPRSNRVLTPHPGEAAKLLQSTPAEVQADRPGAAREIAARFGGVCVLKGAGTLVAGADGAMRLCDRGNPGMATAGMGDVLSGVTGALLGAGMAAADAATAAVWLHATAGDAVAADIGERSLLARDVVERLPAVIAQLEAQTEWRPGHG